jgi:hypothetical protein
MMQLQLLHSRVVGYPSTMVSSAHVKSATSSFSERAATTLSTSYNSQTKLTIENL